MPYNAVLLGTIRLVFFKFTEALFSTKRHQQSYATHLLEMGMDIMTLKEALGHVAIKTTMLYLHVAQLDKTRAFSPLDRLYKLPRS